MRASQKEMAGARLIFFRILKRFYLCFMIYVIRFLCVLSQYGRTFINTIALNTVILVIRSRLEDTSVPTTIDV